MRKKCTIFVLVTVGIVILAICSLIHFNFQPISSLHEKSETSSSFRWIREESYFVDYAVSDNTITFRYSFCFENNTEDNYYISSFVADFSKIEFQNWFKYPESGGLLGELETGENGIIIRSGEKVNVILVFKGEYLGGEVNTELDIPKRLVFCQRFAEDPEPRESVGQTNY